MAKTWAEITADQEFQGLPAADQDTVREAFWQKRVVPTLGDGADVEQARAYFDQRTRIRKQDLPEGATPSTAGAGRGDEIPGRGLPTLADRMQQGLATLADAPAPTQRRRGGVPGEFKPYVPETENGSAPGLSTVKPTLSALEVPTNRGMEFADASREQRKMDDSVVQAKSVGTASPLSRSQTTAFDVEERMRDSNPVARGALQGFAGLGKIGPGAARIAGDFLGIDSLRDRGDSAAQLAGGTERGAAEGLTGNAKLVADITGSIVNSTPTILLGMGGGPALKALFATSAMQEYNTGRDTGFSPADSLGRAAIFGAAEALGERFGFPEQVKILKGLSANMPQGEIARLFGAMLAKEIPGEQLTTAIQFLADKVGPAAQKPNATMADYLNDAAETFKVTVGQSLVMGGGPVAIQTARSTYGQVNQAQASPEQLAASAINQGADAYAKFFKPAPEAATPTAARSDSLKRFDEAAAAWGLSPKAASTVREQAGSMPSDDVPGFLARATAALSKRGLFRKPVDEAGLADLDKRLRPPPAEPEPADPPSPAPKPLDPAATQPETPDVAQPDVDGTAAGVVAAGAGRAPDVVGGELAVGRVADDATQQQPDAATGVVASGGQVDPAGAGRGPDPALTSKRTPEEAIGRMAEQDAQDYKETKSRQIAADNAPTFEDRASDDILSAKGTAWASKTLANKRLRELPNGYRLARVSTGWVIKPENIADPVQQTPAGGPLVPTTKASNEERQDALQEPGAQQDGASQQITPASAQAERSSQDDAQGQDGQSSVLTQDAAAPVSTQAPAQAGETVAAAPEGEFIRAATNAERTGSKPKQRAMADLGENSGREVVFKPYGSKGSGFYYAAPEAAAPVQPPQAQAGMPAEGAGGSRPTPAVAPTRESAQDTPVSPAPAAPMAARDSLTDTPLSRAGTADAAPAPQDEDPQDRQGLRKEDRRLRDLDASASELASQMQADVLEDDFDAAEVMPALQRWATESKVPADELRQAVIKRLNAEDSSVKAKDRRKLLAALDPTKTPSPAKPAKRPPKSFRTTHMVTTAVWVEESGSFEQREVDSEAALKAIADDIKALQAFRACVEG